MKQFIVVLFLLCSGAVFSQSLPDFSKIKLEKGADYKTAEPAVLQAATYISTTPIKEKDVSRTNAQAFLIKWMEGTPDYSFTIDEPALALSKENSNLLGLYLACMTKYCLENPGSAKDQKAVKLNTVKMLLAYTDKTSNNIPMTKQLKKLSDANKKGTLEKELF